MTDVVPMIRALEDCQSHAERALWLLTADLEIFLLCELTIRRTLRQRGFQAGVEYLESELTALRRLRRPNGHHYQNMELCAARGRMERISLGLPAA